MSQGGHNRKNPAYESSIVIDLKELQGEGFLRVQNDLYYNAIRYKIKRYDGGYNFVMVKYGGKDYIEIEYSIKSQKIYLEWINCNYGKRAYFVCPMCKGKTTALCYYISDFACRKCHGLNYLSTRLNHNKIGDIDRRLGNLHEKLKYDGELTGYPSKPLRMKQTTYERLFKQVVDLIEERHKTLMRDAYIFLSGRGFSFSEATEEYFS